MIVLTPAGCSKTDDLNNFTDKYPNDTILRYNHLQAKGSHNSYHIETTDGVVPEWRYTHKPLDEQLGIGVRQFELDVHYSEEGIMVYHVPVIDVGTTCVFLKDCLKIMRQWSDANPEHHAVVVFLEIKDELDPIPLTDKYDDIEKEILSVWPRDRIITPDNVMGDFASLREAVTTNGWPTLGKTRGKIIFHAHDSGEFRDAYLSAYPELKGALMFVDSRPDDSFAGIMPMNDPVNDFDKIVGAVNAGFLVRTRADSCCSEAEQNDRTRLEKALASGAHFISTDFPEPVGGFEYSVEIPGGVPSRCNPLTAPDFCTPQDIENIE